MQKWKLFEIGLADDEDLTTGQVFRTRWCDELYAKINDVLHQNSVNRGIIYCSSKEQAKKLQKQLDSAGHFNSCVSVDAAIKNLDEFHQGNINFLLVIDINPFWEVTQGTNAIILRKFSVPHRVREIVAAGHSCVYDFGNNLEGLDQDEANPNTSNAGENHPFKTGDFGGWVRPIGTIGDMDFVDVEKVRHLCQVQGWKFSIK